MSKKFKIDNITVNQPKQETPTVDIKVKRLHKDAVIPSYAKSGDACVDLVAIDDGVYSDDGYLEFSTGLAVEIPIDFVGLLYPRSSITKYDLMLKNSVGVIDSGYRGEIKFRFRELEPPEQRYPHPGIYKKGDRIGQLMIIPIPKIQFVEVDELSNTDRGTGGFGSTNV